MREKIILMLAVVCVVANAAWAVPLSGSTDQEWGFTTNANPAVPEVVDNPYGTVSAAITHAGTSGNDPTWSDGVWSGVSIKFTTTIPNTNITDPSSYKDIVVEVGYQGDISLAQVKIGDTGYTRTQRETGTYESGSQSWTWVRDYYHIVPNPTSEYICYAFSNFMGGNQELDYVNISTVCTPEPATICLLGLGLLGLLRKRRA